MHMSRKIAMLFFALLVGCDAHERGAATAGDITVRADASHMQTSATQASLATASAADDPSAFVPAGATLVDTVLGDLTGLGTADALIVFTPGASEQGRLGDGPSRTVALLTRNASGRLRNAAENAIIVPCERCGGIAGDPYAYARVESGFVTLAISGGSRQRWFHDYVFRYAPESGTWQLERVVRGVSDSQTDEQLQVELIAADFGGIAFADFDPASLPPPPALD